MEAPRGRQITGLKAAEPLQRWNAVHLNSSSRWEKAGADSWPAKCPAHGLAVDTVEAEGRVSVFVNGTAHNLSWNWTPGAPIYLAGTLGELTQATPANNVAQRVGFALTATSAYFDFNAADFDVFETP